MQNYSHQGPTMLNLPHDIITAVPGQEHGRTQDSKGPPNHGCVSTPALYRTRAPASDYELTTTRPAVVPCRVGCAWQHQGRGGGPETRSGTVQSLKCCPCQQKRAARLPSAAPGSIKRGGPETRLGTVQNLKCCPCQQKRAARLPSAAPGSIKGGGPETRSGTVQSLKCCPCQQKRAARLPSAARSIKGGGPRNALGHRPEPEVLPLPAETSREAPKCCAWQHQEGGPRNALGHRPEPEVLPLPAETSREAPKCCAWQHQGGGPRNALGHRPEPEVLPLPAETSREAPKCCAWQHQGGGAPKRAWAPSRA